MNCTRTVVGSKVTHERLDCRVKKNRRKEKRRLGSGQRDLTHRRWFLRIAQSNIAEPAWLRHPLQDLFRENGEDFLAEIVSRVIRRNDLYSLGETGSTEIIGDKAFYNRTLVPNSQAIFSKNAMIFHPVPLRTKPRTAKDETPYRYGRNPVPLRTKPRTTKDETPYRYGRTRDKKHSFAGNSRFHLDRLSFLSFSSLFLFKGIRKKGVL